MTSSEGVGKQVGPAGGLSKVFAGLTASKGGRAAFHVDTCFSSFHSLLPPPTSSFFPLNFCYLPHTHTLRDICTCTRIYTHLGIDG